MPVQTIAAISTPNAPGGLSVLRISGPGAIPAADRLFRPVSGRPLAEHKGYTAAYGSLWDGDELLDDCVATVFRTPKSYTGEDVVEFSCHGGVYVARRVLQAILKTGVSPAGPGEFTKRAFLNGKISLTQAEAVASLIAAQSEESLRCARSAKDGALFRKIRELTKKILEAGAHISAYMDYPEEEIDPVESGEIREALEFVRRELEGLLSRFNQGKLLREGVETVILGKPNVGKSTLMNLLVGARKSIVTEIPGTTRDVIEETVSLNGLLLRLADTAGIRETGDAVEKAGVFLALERLSSAQLVLAVFDRSSPLSPEDLRLVEAVEGIPCIAVCNKSDLGTRLDPTFLRQRFAQVVEISAKEGLGLDALASAVEEALSLHGIDSSAPMLFNLRQFECASRASRLLREALETLDKGYTLDAVDVAVESVASALLELTGEKVTDAVVDQVFSHFCVGK